MAYNLPVSFELLCLVQWLLKHEKQLLTSLVKHAIEHGFAQELAHLEATRWQQQSADQANALICDLLVQLEDLLFKYLQDTPLDQSTHNAIRTTLSKIEGDNIDDKTLWRSMQQTQYTLDHTIPTQETSGDVHANRILLERLLKNWKPPRKSTVN